MWMDPTAPQYPRPLTRPNNVVSKVRGCCRGMHTKDLLTAFTVLINMIVIVLLVALVDPYKTQLAVVKQELISVQTTMQLLQQNVQLVDYMQSVNNVSRIQGMMEAVQLQVSALSSRSGLVQDALESSRVQISELNSTMTRLKSLVNIPDLGFNGTVGNCLLNYPFPPCSGNPGSGICDQQLPILQANMSVINPHVQLDFFCRWNYREFSVGRSTHLAMSVVAQGQSGQRSDDGLCSDDSPVRKHNQEWNIFFEQRAAHRVLLV